MILRCYVPSGLSDLKHYGILCTLQPMCLLFWSIVGGLNRPGQLFKVESDYLEASLSELNFKVDNFLLVDSDQTS